jgi:putative DNA primase/helicase
MNTFTRHAPLPDTTDLLTAALAYAARGWPVFPLAPGTKKPAISKEDGGHGFHDATTDLEQIQAWWSCWPRANIGMPTGQASGIVVVDVDPRNGGDVAALEALGPMPATLTVRTPSGGTHYYFTVPKGISVPKDNTGKLGKGIDFLGDGAYVVLPPSVLDEGVGYAWRNSEE